MEVEKWWRRGRSQCCTLREDHSMFLFIPPVERSTENLAQEPHHWGKSLWQQSKRRRSEELALVWFRRFQNLLLKKVARFWRGSFSHSLVLEAGGSWLQSGVDTKVRSTCVKAGDLCKAKLWWRGVKGGKEASVIWIALFKEVTPEELGLLLW